MQAVGRERTRHRSRRGGQICHQQVAERKRRSLDLASHQCDRSRRDSVVAATIALAAAVAARLHAAIVHGAAAGHFFLAAGLHAGLAHRHHAERGEQQRQRQAETRRAGVTRAHSMTEYATSANPSTEPGVSKPYHPCSFCFSLYKCQAGLIFAIGMIALSAVRISSRIRRKTASLSSSEPEAAAGSSKLQWMRWARPVKTGQLSRAESHTVIT